METCARGGRGAAGRDVQATANNLDPCKRQDIYINPSSLTFTSVRHLDHTSLGLTSSPIWDAIARGGGTSPLMNKDWRITGRFLMISSKSIESHPGHGPYQQSDSPTTIQRLGLASRLAPRSRPHKQHGHPLNHRSGKQTRTNRVTFSNYRLS